MDVIEINASTVVTVKPDTITIEQKVFGSDKVESVTLNSSEFKKLLQRLA